MLNGRFARVTRLGVGTAVLAAGATLFAGCGSKNDFATVNGQKITHDEYLHALERAPITIPGSQPQQTVNAGRYVLDQLVGRRIVMAEASKLGVAPKDDEVLRRFNVEKRIFEEQMPDKTFETAMKEQGTTPEEYRENLQSQMAETNLLASRLKITDEQMKPRYEDAKKQTNVINQPERVQMRVIVAPAGSKEFSQAQRLLKEKIDFQEVAGQVNQPGPLKSNKGLVPGVTPVSQTPPAWQAKIKATAVGEFFGPVDAPGPQPVKVWVKIEKKLGGYTLSFDDAKPLIKQQIVQEAMQRPENEGIRKEIMDKKLAADFQSSNPKYQSMWQTVQEAARVSGMGQPGAGGAAPPPPIAPMPTPGG
jgi:parvulin-like peptidyl-prolyl isomerase